MNFLNDFAKTARGCGRRVALFLAAEPNPYLRCNVLRRFLLLGVLLPASVHADAGGEALPCQDEPTLSAAAAELLLLNRKPSSEHLTRTVREAGSDAVQVRALLWRGDSDDQARAWLVELAAGADAPTVCGVAHGAGKHLVLASARGGALEPLGAGSRAVKGRLAPDFRAAELVIADADGGLQRLAVDRDQLARGVPIAADLSRPLHVQLVARGRRGPRPVAERTLPARDHASGRAASPPHATPGPATATAASPKAPEKRPAPETRVDDLLAALRSEQRQPELRPNALLAKVAGEHARRVCEQGVVAHELERGSDPQQRLLAAGVRARRVGETVARAASAEAAFTAFERSPSHRLTLLERGFTDAGVGESSDGEQRRCVVILLAEWPRFVGR